MKQSVKLALLLIFSFFSIHACLTQDLASTYKPKNETEKRIIAKIHALPEVMDFFKYVKKDKPDFIINPPGTTDRNCYAMQVGIDNEDIFRTHFWLLINPKTFQVFYEDFDDSGMQTITLREWRYWRKRPEFDKPHKWVNGQLVVITNKTKISK
jgi:hypothetical protein